MTRKSCFAFIVLQAVLLGFLVGVSSSYRSGNVSGRSADILFSLVGPLFVFISPFGIFSLFLSFGFWIFSKSPPLMAKLDRSVSEHPKIMFPVMFLVWKDLRLRLNISAKDDRA
jgi:hypothetical protein